MPRFLPLGGIVCPHAATDRHGGVSGPPFDSLNLGLHVGDDPAAVLANRARVARGLGLDPLHLTFGEQVHGARVAHVDVSLRGRGGTDHGDAIAGVDALATTEPGIPLVILGADCVLVVLHDPAAPALAVVHAGWRGTAAGVIESTVRALVARGARTGRMSAALSAAICGDCYTVSADVARRVGSEHARVADKASGGGIRLDLPGAVAARLRAAGVAAVRPSPACTMCGGGGFFSYRAVAGRSTGRHGVIAWL